MNIQYSEFFCVTHADCISAIDNSLPDLLGTYILVKWMEIVSAKNIRRHLDKDHITVGEKISIEHKGMVKIGEKVEIIPTILEQQKRNVFFEVIAKCNDQIIASAKHERVIIPKKLLKRMTEK